MPQNGILIELSRAQVNQVLREAVRENGPAGLDSLALGQHDSAVAAKKMDDVRLSRSLLRALMVLASYPRDGSARSVSEVAKQLGMGISTAHRYTSTFAEVGVLERDPVSRQYRLAINGASAATPA